jgi:hypothetical protein
MKKLILAICLLGANLVQANDTPAHSFDTRPTYRFHPNQHEHHFPAGHRTLVLHRMPYLHHFAARFNAPMKISIPDFMQADQEMTLSENEAIRISTPDLKVGEQEMLDPVEMEVRISMPDFEQADLDIMLQ